MREKGLVHLYCGEGKGKTTAAMGLALRCVGHHKSVVIAQFLKNGTSGECRFLSTLDHVTVLAANPVGKFSFSMNDEERASTQDAILRTFQAATDFAIREHVFLLILDEVCAAIQGGFLPEEKVLEFLHTKPEEMEVVLTGRNPTKALQDASDYISEICKRKHPFDRGIHAREGIEQ